MKPSNIIEPKEIPLFIGRVDFDNVKTIGQATKSVSFRELVSGLFHKIGSTEAKPSFFEWVSSLFKTVTFSVSNIVGAPPRSKNLAEKLHVDQPEQLWLLKEKEVLTKEGLKYIHSFTDVYSNQIMGLQISKDSRIDATISALFMALEFREKHTPLVVHHAKPELKHYSRRYIKILRDNNISPSYTTD